MSRSQTIIAANFALSAILVFAFVAFAKLTGMSVDQQFMLFRRDLRFPYLPAWVAALLAEAVFVGFAIAPNSRKVRFMMVGLSTWSLVASVLFPVLLEEVYATKFYGAAVWWYACASAMIYGLFRPQDAGLVALCASQLNQIDLAKQMWKTENNKPPSVLPQPADLTVYLPFRKFPACPDGGTYSIGKLGEKPSCSIHRQALQKDE